MKKILFTDRFGLTDAVLSGQKTMTRRIMPQQPRIDDCLEWGIDDKGKAYVAMYGATWLCDIYPTYQIGEEVAIAQAYQTLRWPALPGIDWKTITDEVTHSKGWNNKMFVKAEYMPHRIKVTDIKLERLNDITDEDCLKEGVEKWIDCYIVSGIMENQGKNNVCFDTPREAFAALIDRISGKGTWQRNPWLFAYEFKLIKD